MVLSLLYAANITRVDVCYAVAQLCRFTANPSKYHLHAAYRVLKYLSDTSNYCLVFGRKSKDLELDIAAFTDADFAGDKTDRKSTSGTIVQFNGDTIKWSSKKQKCVALSTTEAEYIAGGESAKESLWVSSWVLEVFGVYKYSRLIGDNKSAICLMKNDTIHDRSKHIDIKYHFLRDEVEKGHIVVEWVETTKELADILTKPVTKQVHHNLRYQLMGRVQS